MTKYIFVDLDECLFHCRTLGGDRIDAEMLLRDGEKLINANNSGRDIDNDFYASKLRPGAHDLLKALRAIPDSRVCVLTSSVTVYANANNKAHDLGFDPDDIYAREELQSGAALSPDLFGSGPTYLIDNLPRYENRIKLMFLRSIATNGVRYIKVTEFWGQMDAYENEFSAEGIQSIVNDINNLGNSS